NGTVAIVDDKLKIPKLKSLIKIKLHRNFTGIIKSATISKTPTGKYFVSILVDTENNKLPGNNNKIGIDLGIKDFAIIAGNYLRMEHSFELGVSGNGSCFDREAICLYRRW
ncbi:MAG: transposase, partial [Clostridium sp.]|nr:transposase [Clostridium sp.]